jgi:P2 family phage major capsid protein
MSTVQLSSFAKTGLSKAIGQIAKGFGVTVGEIAETFSVAPSIAQKLQEEVRAKNTVLAKVNVLPVTEITGQKIMLSVNGAVSSRTDLTDSTKERTASTAHSLKANAYTLKETNTDVAIPYNVLNTWAHVTLGMAKMIRNQVKQQVADDRVMCGFNGTSAADETDRDANPLLQDLNIGWLKLLETENSDNVFLEDIDGSGKIIIGATEANAYKNLDQLVTALRNVIPVHKRKGLVALVGEDVMDEVEQAVWAIAGNKPSEKDKVDALKILGTAGGLAIETPEYFPANCVMVTAWSNLSVYYQESSWRSQTINNPRRNQLEDFNTRNEGYVIEDVEACALAKNIEFE